MAIAVMSKVWDVSQAGGTELLLLLAIADFADEQGYAYPSVPTLAKKIRMSPRNTQYILQKLVAMGELEITLNAGRRGSNLYQVKTLHPASLAPCSPLQGRGEAHCTEGVKPIAYKPSGTVIEPSEVSPKPRAKREKKQEMTLAERRAYCEEQDIPVIPEDAAVIRFAQDARIPGEFIELAWEAFVTKYTEDQPTKRYADWALAFGNAVKGNWLKLWYFDKGAGEYQLTTVGQQQQNVQKARQG